MATVKCPVKGFERVEITYPDEWLMEHTNVMYLAELSAPVNASPSIINATQLLALCDIKGLEKELARDKEGKIDLAQLPLHFQSFFNWAVKLVIIDGYIEAQTVPNE